MGSGRGRPSGLVGLAFSSLGQCLVLGSSRRRTNTVRRVTLCSDAQDQYVVRSPAAFPRAKPDSPPATNATEWKAHFLEHHWQKKPLLIRAAFDPEEISKLITPDELAGLACEQEVESRIVSQPRPPDGWELEVGPFEEEHFATLPETHCTLLVQEVNRHVPECLPILDHFSCIPNFRLDDLMVSYAGEGGGVGPHLDNYDVFLLQANGTRRWRISAEQLSRQEARDAPHIPEIPVRVLKDMQVDLDWTLEAGDMLYLPARVPHWGVAEHDDGCMTFSIGFRSPTTAEIVTRFADHVSEREGIMDQFLEDAHDDLVKNMDAPGKISVVAMQNAKAQAQSALFGDGKFEAWFAKAVSEPKRYRPDESLDDQDDDGDLDTANALNGFFDELGRPGTPSLSPGPLFRLGGSVFCYREDEPLLLIVDGVTYCLDPSASEAIEVLCGRAVISLADGSTERKKLIKGLGQDAPLRHAMIDLFKKGSLFLGEGDHE